jgi:hypothetical protein
LLNALHGFQSSPNIFPVLTKYISSPHQIYFQSSPNIFPVLTKCISSPHQIYF